MKKLIRFIFVFASLTSFAQTPTEISNILAGLRNDLTGSASISANATSGATINCQGVSAFTVQLTGTWTATVQVQISVDGTNFVNITGSNSITNRATGAYVASGNLTANGIYEVKVAGINAARVITTAYTSGTIVVTTRASNADGTVAIEGGVNVAQINGVTPLMGNGVTGTGSQRVTIASDNTANTNPWLVTLRGATANGTTTSFLNSAATTNATNLKATAGTVYTIHANNTTASAKYLRLYNLASAPTVGTSTPVMVITIPASSSISVSVSALGIAFGTGISYAITNAAAYLDATAVAAGDVQILIGWQ